MKHDFSVITVSLGTVGSALGVMKPEREAGHSPAFITEVKIYMPYGLCRGNFFVYLYVFSAV